MAKKILIFLLAVLLVACFAACQEKDDEVYTVTLKGEDADYGVITITNGVPSQDLPAELDVPAEMKSTHIFGYWYYINPQTGTERKVDSTDDLKSLKSDTVLLPKFVEIYVVSYNKNAGGYYIDNLGKKGVMQELVVPETYTTSRGEYPIVGISKDAFKGETALKTIEFTSVIKDIGSNAFDGCTSLQTVTFKAGVEELGKNIFRKVESVTEITGPAELVSQLSSKLKLNKVVITDGEVIKDACFEGATHLSSISIAEGVTTIGDAAFKGCTGIKEIVIPASVSYVGSDAFLGCTQLQSLEVAPGGEYYTSGNGGNYVMAYKQYDYDVYGDPVYDELGNHTYRENVLIAACKNAKLDDTIEYIDQYAFQGISDLKEVYIGRFVVEIHEEAFIGCNNLVSITVNDNNNYYTDGNASNCIIRTQSGRLVLGAAGNIVIPDFVETISKYAFADCNGLTGITIPSNVKCIVAGTFANCTKLTDVTIAADSENLFIEDGAFDNTSIKNITLPTEFVSYFVGVSGNKIVTANINAGDNVGSAAFKGCQSLTTVVLNDGVKVINDSAFEGCSALSKVEGAENVEIIRYSAFKGCKKLTKLGTASGNVFHITEKITTLGDSAFDGTGIVSLKVDSRPSLGYKVFANCASLTTLELGEGIVIDFDAFAGCKKITTATLPADAIVRSLRESTGIKTLTVTSGTIEAYAFKDCKSLSSLTLGKDVVEVQARAFDGCSALATISVAEDHPTYSVNGGCLVNGDAVILGSTKADLTKLDKTITRIAKYAFSGIGVKEIVISENLIVEEYAFFNCKSLTKVTIKSASADNIKLYALDGCDAVSVAKITTAFVDKLNWSSLKELTVISGDLIPAEAFKDCVTLTSVVIESAETEVGEDAFAGCVNLKKISVHDVDDLKGFDLSVVEDVTILNVDGVLSAGSLAGFTYLKKIVIVPGEYTVEGNPFSSTVVIESLEAPASVIEAIDNSVLANIVDLTVNSGNLQAEGLVFTALNKLVIEGADTTVDAKAFVNAPVLSEVAVKGEHNSYKSIGKCLVAGNTELILGVKDAKISSGITTVGEYAFSGRAIEGIVIPDGVAVNGYAFANCTLLTSATIGKDVILADKAFASCVNLQKVVIGTGVVIAEDDKPFDGCYAITELACPADVLNNAVVSLDVLTTLTVNGGVWKILANAPALSTLYIEGDVQILPDNSLISGVNNIKVIEAKSATSYIVDGGCLLTKDGKTLVLGTGDAVIPESVTTIQAYAFSGCRALKSIVIPKNVAEIQSNAFSGCVGVEVITVDAANTKFVSVNNSVLTADGKTLVVGCKTTTIASTVKEIAAYAFAGSALETIVIPAGVEVVGDGAFSGCYYLTKVVFANGSAIKALSAGVFARCTSLSKVVVPTGVTSIDESAFSGCAGVTVYFGGSTVEEWNALRSRQNDTEVVNVLILGQDWYYFQDSDIRDM